MREIADKYLLMTKSIKAELSAVKEMAAGQISEATQIMKGELLQRLTQALSWQKERDRQL